MEALCVKPIEVNGKKHSLILPQDNVRIIKGTGDKTEKRTKIMKKYGVASMQEMLKQESFPAWNRNDQGKLRLRCREKTHTSN